LVSHIVSPQVENITDIQDSLVKCTCLCLCAVRMTAEVR
jgi:hypothetical protein